MDIHLERSPLLTPDGDRMIRNLREHPDAPRFNYATGDRLHPQDLDPIAQFREQLRTARGPRTRKLPDTVLEQCHRARKLVPWLRRNIPAGADLERDWHTLPTTSR